MSHIFSDLPFVKVYLNSILIHSYSDEEDYLNKLPIVFEHLQYYNLKLKVKKCEFLKKK